MLHYFKHEINGLPRPSSLSHCYFQLGEGFPCAIGAVDINNKSFHRKILFCINQVYNNLHEKLLTCLRPYHLQLKGIVSRYLAYTARHLSTSPSCNSNSTYRLNKLSLGHIPTQPAVLSKSNQAVIECGTALCALGNYNYMHFFITI